MSFVARLKASPRSDYSTYCPSDHTMCLPEVGANCKKYKEEYKYIEKPFEDADKDLIVKLHNEKRRMVSFHIICHIAVDKSAYNIYNF